MKAPVPHRFASFLLAATLLLAALPALAAGPLIFSCAADNDLFRVASDNGVALKRCDTPEAAVAAAGEGDGVLLLAGAYPQQTTAVAPEVFAQAARKHLRLYVEYPAALPDTKIDAPRKVKLERAVVASNTFGPALARMRLLIIHGCHFLPMEAKSPHLVLARVAGYDTAVFGLPETEVYPVLFEHPRGDILVATTKLSQFVTGRYAPNDAWPVVWHMVFTWLAPGAAVPALKWTPTVRPRYDRDATLPATAATEAIVRGVDWSTKTRMLVHDSWKDRPQPPAPDASWPCGDGELGLLEGMRSEVDYLGRQPIVYNLRSDCIGESALAFALRAGIENDTRSTRIASNLLDWLYDRSGLFIDTPEKPSYGMLAWTPDAAGALYQDNDVRVMLGCMGTAAILGTDRWDEKLLINILANFRTTGRLGFRGERIEHPDLLQRGWRSFWDAPLVRLSPHFEAWTWAAYLWLYDKTRFAPLLERTKLGINLMMEKYPSGWFWTNGIQQERARMLLVLAWLVRVEDTPQHRAWLDRIATDMGAAQDECGAIREELGDMAMGYFPPPESNAKYGTNEAPLIHANGDPVADLLYTCNFAFLGLHEAAAVTGDARYQRMEDKLADFLLRIQVHSEPHPELDGAWFRAFDFKRWEYFGSNADAGWGAWCVESGWTQGWIPTVLDLRRRGVSLWDLTAHSTIARHMDKIRPAMLPDEAVAATPESKRVRHAAVGSSVLSMTKPDPRFNLGGTAGLVDGELLTADWAAKWLAYIQRDFEAVIDLGSVIPIQQLGITCMQQVFHGMYLPTEVEFAVSTDNITFIPAGTAKPDVAPTVAGPLTKALLTSTPEATRGRYLRVHAHNRAVIPAGLEGAGNQAWLMVDEILVNPVGLQQAGVEMDNGRIKARFTPVPGGIQQKYFAKHGAEWVPVAESLRPPKPLPPAANALYDSARDPAHRLLVSEILDTIGEPRRENGTSTIELSGHSVNGLVRQRVTLGDGMDYAHIEVTADLLEPRPKLEYLLSTFTFRCDGKPDFIHTPKSKGPGWYADWPSAVPRVPDSPEFILGDRIFYAPAVIAQQNQLLGALVPDLDLINRLKVPSPDARPRGGIAGMDPTPVDSANNSMPTALDYTLTSGLDARPLLAYGLIDFIPVQHMRWRHPSDGTLVRTLSSPRVGYGFDLFMSADAAAYRGFQRIARYQWQRYGSPLLAQPRPQAMPFDEYCKVIYPAILGSNNNQGFAEFELDGQQAGGWCLAVPFWANVLSNSPWWNNSRDAVGMDLWGQRTNDEKLMERSRRIVNLALLAPRVKGLFACDYHLDRKEWKPGLVFAGDDKTPHMGLDPSNVRPRSYHTAACSITAVHLLRYYQLCGKDARILAFLRPYADLLLQHIGPDGQIPMFFNADGMPNNILPDHAENGANLWFLCQLFAATKDQRYLEGAEKAAGYLIKQVIPRQRWRDFEGFFSCGIKPVDWEDKTQDQDTRGQMPMIWAAAGLGELFRLTGKRPYLDAGEQVIDYVSLYQAVWDPHFVYTAYAFGGFDTDNGDAAWLNCHTAWSVGTLAFYGKELGRQDLLERAVAAARAGVTLINHPRHISNNIYRFPNCPPGLGPENINHEGSEQNCMRTSPGSGEGTGLFAGLGDALRELGGVYVDFGKQVAVGVDGVYVRSYRRDGKTLRLELENQLAALPDPYDQPYAIELRIVGLEASEYDLVINGGPAQRLDAERLAHCPVEASGKPTGFKVMGLKGASSE